MNTIHRIQWDITESTATFEKRFPGLVKMDFRNLQDFKRTYPPEYNLYYPPDKFGSNNFDIILRILPEYALMIYSGEKKYEFRKYVPKHTGLVFLLETNNHADFTGCFFFKKIMVDELNALWKMVGDEAGSREKFNNYFRGKKYGVALEILDSERFEEPIPFEHVYNQCSGMPSPPHPYVYMYTPVYSKLSTLLRARLKRIINSHGL